MGDASHVSLKAQKQGAPGCLFYGPTHLYNNDEGRLARWGQPAMHYPASPEVSRPIQFPKNSDACQPMYPQSPEVGKALHPRSPEVSVANYGESHAPGVQQHRENHDLRNQLYDRKPVSEFQARHSRSPAVDRRAPCGNTSTLGINEAWCHSNPKHTHSSPTAVASRIGDVQNSHLQHDPVVPPIAVHSSNSHTTASDASLLRQPNPNPNPNLNPLGSTKFLSAVRRCPTSLSPVLQSRAFSHKEQASDEMDLLPITVSNVPKPQAARPQAQNAGCSTPRSRHVSRQASSTPTTTNSTSQTRHMSRQASSTLTAYSPASQTRTAFNLASPALTACSPTSQTRNAVNLASPTPTAISPTSLTKSTFNLASPKIRAFSLTARAQNVYSAEPESQNARSPAAASNVFSPLVRGRSDMSALVMQLRLQVASMQQRHGKLEVVNRKLQQELAKQTNTVRMTEGKLKIMETALHHSGGSFSTSQLAASMKEVDVLTRSNLELKDANATLYNALKLAVQERDGDEKKHEEATKNNTKLQAELKAVTARCEELEKERKLLHSRCERHDKLLEQWQGQEPRSEAKCLTANASTQVDNVVDHLQADNEELRKKLQHLEEQLDIKYSQMLEDFASPVKKRCDVSVSPRIDASRETHTDPHEKNIASAPDNTDNSIICVQ